MLVSKLEKLDKYWQLAHVKFEAGSWMLVVYLDYTDSPELYKY